MVKAENKGSTNTLKQLENFFEAWEKSKSEGGRPITLGNVTVTHKGLTSPPLIKVDRTRNRTKS
jgi:hypothetical protein